MSGLLAARAALSLWSWRKPIAFLVTGVLMLMLAAAALVVSLPALAGGAGTRMRLPVEGAVLTQPFGCTPFEREPFTASCPSHHFHSGIDLAAPPDTTVLAATAGVAIVRRDRAGYGLYVVVIRDQMVSTLYGHLDMALVVSGAQVAAGDPIGLLGSTGNSTGPHLHFEVRINGLPVDPLPMLPTEVPG